MHTPLHEGHLSSITLPPSQPAPAFMAEVIPQPQDLIEGVLVRGGKMIVGGAPKSYKTWSLLDLCISISVGEPWLGLPTRKARVIYGNLELPDFAVQSRIRAILEARQVDAGDLAALHLLNLRGFNCNLDMIERHVLKTVAEIGAVDLIVIDPVYKLLLDMDESGFSDAVEVCAMVDRVTRQTGAAVIFSVHFSKGNQSRRESLDRVCGSGVWGRDPDSIVTLTKHDTPDVFVVEMDLRLHPAKDAFCVRWSAPRLVLAEGQDPTKLLTRRNGLSKFKPERLLALLPPEGLNRASWLRIAEKLLGLKESTFDKLLITLKKTNRVTRSDRLYLPIPDGAKP